MNKRRARSSTGAAHQEGSRAIRDRTGETNRRACNDDGTFKSREQLEQLYFKDCNLKPTDDVIAYCSIGKRSSLTWYALTYLLGFECVRNYDGSWTEWGILVGVPIEMTYVPKK